MTTQLTRRGLLSVTATASVAGATLTACGASDENARGSGASVTGHKVRVWFMEGSISDAGIEHLEKAFASASPGNTLAVEIQPWENITSKLQTALASDSESPDLVETGNTQCSAFSSVGAFMAVDDMYDELGGDDLIPSFIDAGRWDGKLYALPLYAGARGVYYRKDIFAAAGVAEPTTLDEFTEAVISLGKANPQGVADFSGMYLSAGDEHTVTSLLFAGGGEWAVKEGDSWKQKLTDPKTTESLKRIKRLFTEGTAYALDSQASQNSFDQYFNDGKVAVVLATGPFTSKIAPTLWDGDQVGVIPIPGAQPGEVGKTFAGGSTISIPTKAKNPDLAKEALRVIFGDEFQQIVASDGWVPGNVAYGDTIPGAFGAISATIAEHSKLTPNTPQWGVAEGNNLVRDFWTEIAQNDDVESVAEKYGERLEKALNS